MFQPLRAKSPAPRSGSNDTARLALTLMGFLALNLAANLTYQALYQTSALKPLHAALIIAQPYLLLYIGLSEMRRIAGHVGDDWRRIAEALRLPFARFAFARSRAQ